MGHPEPHLPLDGCKNVIFVFAGALNTELPTVQVNGFGVFIGTPKAFGLPSYPMIEIALLSVWSEMAISFNIFDKC